MTYIKKGIFIIIGTAMMVVLLLAIGGLHVLPEQCLGPVLQGDLWIAVGVFFSMIVLPGAVVGYAACHSRVLGLIEFIIFVVCSIISGFSFWWILTAVLLIVSYIFCIKDNVGFYDELEPYDKLSVLVPAMGASRIIEEFFLEDIFDAVGRVISVIGIVCSVALPYFHLFAEQNIEKGTIVGNALKNSAFINLLVGFGNSLSGIIFYYVFLPLFSVLALKHLYTKPKLTKVYAVIVGGYNAYRGFFIFMPILFSVGNLGQTQPAKGASPVFNNLFGIEACCLMAMLLGGILCIRVGFNKKRTFADTVCGTDEGSLFSKCILMAAFESTLVMVISPAVIYVAWAILMLVFIILATVFMSMVPESKPGIDWTHYNWLKNQGVSESEAFNQARIRAMQNSK